MYWNWIQAKLETYEEPFDPQAMAQGWDRVQRALPRSKAWLKWATATVAVVIVGISMWSLMLTTPSVSPSKLAPLELKVFPKITRTSNPVVVPPSPINSPLGVVLGTAMVTPLDTPTNFVLAPPLTLTRPNQVVVLDSIPGDSILVNIEEPKPDTVASLSPLPLYTLYVPTAFTPNGDGVNDEFGPIGTFITAQRYQFLIYTRWGELVFETWRPEWKWDGANSPTGSYIWILIYQDESGQMITRKGSVYLIK